MMERNMPINSLILFIRNSTYIVENNVSTVDKTPFILCYVISNIILILICHNIYIYIYMFICNEGDLASSGVILE